MNVVAVYDPRMESLIDPDAELEKLADGAKHSEGPVYFPEDDSVIYSDVNGDCLYRWNQTEGVSIFHQGAYYYHNGNAISAGHLISCSHGKRAVMKREKDGTWKTLCNRYKNKRLNSPNDLIVKSDGTIWFTDPPFGLTQPEEGCGGQQEQAGSFVYRFDPQTQEIDAVIKEMERPNGLAFSPDEKILYVSDTSQADYIQGHHYVRAYEVIEGKHTGDSEVFTTIEPGQPDGLKVDNRGNLFISSADSVQVYAFDSNRLGKIFVPEVVANLAFGGKENKSLFITAGGSLYRIFLR